MRRITPDERRIVNIHEAEYTPWTSEDGLSNDQSVLQLNTDRPLGVGFHIYRMEAGAVTEPHQHNGDEEFLVLEGELVDNDDTVYRKGDLVWLRSGTQHSSRTPNGCLLAVYVSGLGKPVG